MPTSDKDFRQFFEWAENSDEYWVEGAIIEFTEEIVRLMEDKGITRTALAERLGVTQPQITKILRGENNFTLKTMVKIARALKSEVRLHLQPEGSNTRWVDYFSFSEEVVHSEEVDLKHVEAEYTCLPLSMEPEEALYENVPTSA